jgi:hypothetical protein
LATSARCRGGNALNCSMTLWAVMPQMNHDRISLASGIDNKSKLAFFQDIGPVRAILTFLLRNIAPRCHIRYMAIEL